MTITDMIYCKSDSWKLSANSVFVENEQTRKAVLLCFNALITKTFTGDTVYVLVH